MKDLHNTVKFREYITNKYLEVLEEQYEFTVKEQLTNLVNMNLYSSKYRGTVQDDC